MIISQVEREFKIAQDYFPALSILNDKSKWIIKGRLDICDIEGQFWESFHIQINIPVTYPYFVPVVLELSTVIPREHEFHISVEGECCIDIPHKLIHESRRGINITEFIRNKVYPFFANFLFYRESKAFAAGEYMHRFEGIKQFYEQDLKLNSAHLAIKAIYLILNNKIPGRNDTCICGKGKLKDCHLKALDFLKSVNENQLRADLKEFNKIIEMDEAKPE